MYVVAITLLSLIFHITSWDKTWYELYDFPIIEHVLYLTRTYAYYIHREKIIMLGRWPGDHGRRQRKILPSKSQPWRAHTPATNTGNNLNFSNSILFPGNCPTCADNDQPSPVLSHSSLTTLSTASLTHTKQSTPMPGLATCEGYQQHTTGNIYLPHIMDHTAHHGVGEREWGTGSGGSDVTSAVGLSSHVSYDLSHVAHSVSSTSEEGGLMLV